MTTNLSRIIPPQNVALDLQVADKQQLFEQIGQLFQSQSALDAADITANLLARESLASTGLGHGVAVPHGRIQGLTAPVAAFARLSPPLDFGSPDGRPVELMIILLIPDNVTQKHLEILSEVAEMFSDDDFRARLASEKNAETVHNMLVTWLPAHMKKT